MKHPPTGVIWLNACIAVGICLCTLSGGWRSDLELMGYIIASIGIIFGFENLVPLLTGSLIVKFVAALIDTPLVYLGCFLLRRGELNQKTI